MKVQRPMATFEENVGDTIFFGLAKEYYQALVLVRGTSFFDFESSQKVRTTKEGNA